MGLGKCQENERQEKTEGLFEVKGDKRDKTTKYNGYFWMDPLAYYK